MYWLKQPVRDRLGPQVFFVHHPTVLVAVRWRLGFFLSFLATTGRH